MIRLGVNIDHVATVRNARGERFPEPVAAAHAAVLETRTREQVEPPRGPADVSAAREDAERMHEALAAIPPRDRLLVTWIEEGWTYRAIARVLALRENSIGPLLKRARERLGHALNGTPSNSMYGSARGTPPTERSERP